MSDSIFVCQDCGYRSVYGGFSGPVCCRECGVPVGCIPTKAAEKPPIHLAGVGRMTLFGKARHQDPKEGRIAQLIDMVERYRMALDLIIDWDGTYMPDPNHPQLSTPKEIAARAILGEL